MTVKNPDSIFQMPLDQTYVTIEPESTIVWNLTVKVTHETVR